MFYVYAHLRPDGTPFYVGKGKGRRCYNFTARSRWHKSVVKKYGVENIIVECHPCASEVEAFFREKLVIQSLVSCGVSLVNLTSGGEGTSGWNHSGETIAKIRAANSGQKSHSYGRALHTTPHTDTTKDRIRRKTVAQFSDELNRFKHSLLSRSMWADPTYVKKQLESRAKRDYTVSATALTSTLSFRYICVDCGYVNNAGNLAQHLTRTGHSGKKRVAPEASPGPEKS